MRLTLTFGLLALLLACLWFVMLPVGSSSMPGRNHPEQSGAVLAFRDLAPSEMIVIVHRRYRSDGTSERLYQIQGGHPFLFATKVLRGPVEEEIAPPVTGALRREEIVGLDAYLLFLRRGFGGGNHRRSDTVVGYYRDGTKIGEERFRDDLSWLGGFRFEGGRVSVPDENPAPFPAEVFREIVPPWVIEQRVKIGPTTDSPGKSAGNNPEGQ